MYKLLTYNEFVDTYKPISNSITNQPDSITFETYGEEVDFVFAQPDKNVWTEVDVDGGVFIVAGKHFVNRIQYFVTELPYDSEDQEVIVSYYHECPTCGCFGGFGTNDDGTDCSECSDDNTALVVYPETRDDLIELFGKAATETTL